MVVVVVMMISVRSFVDQPVLSLRPPSLGRFEDPWADEETVLGHPGKDVLSYLETCASALGVALDLEAKKGALRTLRSLTLRVVGGDLAASTKNTSASLPSGGKVEEGSGRGTGAEKNGERDRGDGVGKKIGAISSAQDVYAAVTTALSQALVHCKRFEVRGGKQRGKSQVRSPTDCCFLDSAGRGISGMSHCIPSALRL